MTSHPHRPTCIWRLALALTALMAATLAPGCAQEEHVILLEVLSPQDVGDLTITVIPLDGMGMPDSAPRPVNQTAAQIRETPLHVAIRLNEPREVMVVLSAPAAAVGTHLVAQRCMSVAGVVRDTVWLVPLDSTEDADGDLYPRRAVAACARPSEDGMTPVPCASSDPFLCAAMAEVDCDDSDPALHPGAVDACGDTIDQNCDGMDEPCADGDGDGIAACRPGDDPTTCDCNDHDADTYPGAPDSCEDPADTDCDGTNDLCDADCDGYPVQMTDAPYADCDDTSATQHSNETLRGIYELADGDRLARGCEPLPMTPAAADTCTMGPGGEPVGDGLDQDCNGFVDDGPGCTDTTDRDRDGSRACTGGMTVGCDPNDCDPGIAPGRTEICGNAFDEDGDGTAQDCLAGDADHDGHVAEAMGGDDCNDADPHIYAGAPENCMTTVSESCTENLSCTAFGGDNDGDGYVTGVPGAAGDCDDRDADVHPFAAEDPCDGVDNDCDGVVDEVLRPEDATPGAPDGCVRTGGGATDVDYNLSAPYSEYCGGCGVITAPNEDCCSGAPTQIDAPSSCGTCGYDCGPHTACPTMGSDPNGEIHSCACSPDASGRWADCDGSLLGASGGDGCESDLDTDEMNCGMCGNRCGAHQTCVAGACTCDTPWLDCDGRQLNGCEINSSNDVGNCGRCGMVCNFASGSPDCRSGSCELGGCDPGFDNCNGSAADGCETPLTTLTNCGRCGETCGAIQHATATCPGAAGSSRCDYSSCAAGFLDCTGTRANGCETAFSTTNCGACGTVCGANESCNGTGDCQCGTGPSAGTGEACTGTTPDCCGNACTDLQTDVNNCGACGNRCGTGETCSGGRCGCGATRASVGTGEACVGGTPDCCGTTCVNVANNAANCGVCGNTCGPSETCGSGHCACGGTVAAGVGEACAGTGNECCSGSCFDVRSTVSHCGSCTTDCAVTAAHSAEQCMSSMCDYSSCDMYFLDCNGDHRDGCEIDGRALGNCGSCGNTCAAIQHATAICTTSATCDYSTCTFGFLDCAGGRANGCETGFSTANCGACGTICGPSESCNGSGDCQCGTGPSAAAGEACTGGSPDCCGNSCVNLQTDVNNCGACGNRCGAGETCMAGSCRCGATMGTVGSGEACTGASNECCSGSCTNVSNNASSCGACGNACGASETCMAGSCRCGATMGAVGSGEACTGASNECCSGSCTNVGNNASSCGACGNACGASETCMAGSCRCGGTMGTVGSGEACTGAGNECCSGTCANVNTSTSNCGTCGNACGTSETCSSGDCACGTTTAPTGQACPGANNECCSGACENVGTSTTDCGVCGHACGAMETCDGTGRCQCGTGGPTSAVNSGEACEGANPTCDASMMMCVM